MDVFIVWTKYQSRVEALVKEYDKKNKKIKIIYRENSSTKSKVKKIMMYASYFLKDIQDLNTHKPSNIFIQLPPTVSLLAPYVYKIFNKSTKIIGDGHNSLFRKPWSNRTGTKTLINKLDVLIVHNKAVYENIQLEFSKKLKIVILEDNSIAVDKEKISTNLSLENNLSTVFFPASFNLDEPIIEFIEAVKLNKNVEFFMTGNKEKLSRNFGIDHKEVPDNLTLTGWLSNKEYEQLLINCDILVGLTIYDDIQMSVSNEGLSYNKAMVLSKKNTLLNIYKNAAIFTENDAISISKSINEALNAKQKLIENSKLILEEKNKRFKDQFEYLDEKIN